MLWYGINVFSDGPSQPLEVVEEPIRIRSTEYVGYHSPRKDRETTIERSEDKQASR